MGTEKSKLLLDGGSGVPASVEIPIDGVLDLHTFAPSDAKSLVAEYLDECARRGVQQARIIHGKGQGVLRRIVHCVLERHSRVLRYSLADGAGGSWGATVVDLQIAPNVDKDGT